MPGPEEFEIDTSNFDKESDEEAAERARIELARAGRMSAVSRQQNKDIKAYRKDPTAPIEPSVGSKRFTPDFSDPEDPASTPYKGAIAPAAAGERSRAEQAKGIKDFINKYSKLAVDRFYGSSTAGEFSGPKAGSALAAIAPRFAKRGGMKGASQLMDKSKALELVDKIPTAPQDEAMQMQRELARYVWSIHQNARPVFRQAVMKQLGITNNKPITVQKRDADGSIYYDEIKPSETDKFKKLLGAVSQAFETDSIRVKADLNLMSSASGALQRGAGRGGKADAATLAKQARFGKPPKIVAKPPTTRLSKDLAAQAAQEPEPSTRAPSASGVNPFTGDPTALNEPVDPRPDEPEVRTTVAPDDMRGGLPIVSRFPRVKSRPAAQEPQGPAVKGPTVRKKHEAINRWVNEMIDLAVADHVPTWWDEL